MKSPQSVGLEDVRLQPDALPRGLDGGKHRAEGRVPVVEDRDDVAIGVTAEWEQTPQGAPPGAHEALGERVARRVLGHERVQYALPRERPGQWARAAL